MKEEEILTLIAAPFMAQWINRQATVALRVPTLQNYSDARDRALYQAQELLTHATEIVHGPND